MARDPKKTAAEPEFDARLIRDLALLLEETGLSEIEIEREGRRIRVARQLTVSAAAPPANAAKALAAPALEPIAVASDIAKHPGAVTSPMVGTAFLTADPASPPYVKVGDTVTKGQTLLIIDAMKTMNPIPAPRAGKVREIMFTSGSPVEYGQPLMIIE